MGMRNEKRRKPATENVVLSQGIIIAPDAQRQEEKRKYTLLLKGLLVYLLVMGAMGCFLSALNMDYSAVALNIAVLLSAFFCASLYYSKAWERIGYLLLLAIIIWLGSLFRTYINSGFYAIANEISQRAAVFFDTSAARNYSEQIGNRYAAVTISMSFIGCVCCVFTNIRVSRSMYYKTPVLASMLIMLIPLYLELEPDLIYVVMFITGVISVYIIKSGGHYELTLNNDEYSFKPKKQKISYVYSVRAAAMAVGLVFVVSAVLAAVLSLVYPKEQFKTAHGMSAIKKSTMDTVENISILGIMGLFNFSPNTGGLTNGTLGGVSSVRFDLQPDLVVEFAPYNDERLYLKTFVGGVYLPYSNRWSRLVDLNGQPINEETDETAVLLRRRYEEGREYSAKGVMKITNVAAPIGVYLPYYSEDVDKQVYVGRTQEYTFYPRVYDDVIGENDDDRPAGAGKAEMADWIAEAEEVEGTDWTVGAEEAEGADWTAGAEEAEEADWTAGAEEAEGTDWTAGAGEAEGADWTDEVGENDWSGLAADYDSMDEWLQVPRENMEVIGEFVNKAGLTEFAGDAQGAVKALAGYYQDNIPYTLRPGMTPYRKDFINYFLAENKRGYCAHFASAATLIFRYLGIPARYVEGYAVDPSDIAGRGEMLSDKDYGEYYDGFSPLQANAVVSVEATDANAHAWVEVYDSKAGWIVAEVTPISYEDEEGESLWQRLMDFLTGDSDSETIDSEDEGEEDEGGLDEQTRLLYVRILVIAIVFTVAALLSRPLIKKVRYWYNYYNADKNSRLIIQYQRYIAKIAKKEKELTKMVNYEDQINLLLSMRYWKINREEAKTCIKILEKAGFSPNEISDEEYNMVITAAKIR